MREQEVLAANEDATATNEAVEILCGAVAVANQYAANEKDNWVLLAPYGKFPNVVGMQHFDRNDATTIANEFDSLPNVGVKQLGLPWYIGHPDHPAFKEQYKDGSAYGRIRELRVGDEGLWANVKWNQDGKELIKGEKFHGHSTNWRMRKNSAGEFHPFSLKSVGFTNEPGIPVPAITAANEKGTTMAKGPKLTDYIAKLLGKPELAAANEDDAMGEMDSYAANAAKTATDFAKLQTDHAELNTKHGALTNAHQVLATAHDAVVKKYGCCNEKGELVLPELTAKALTDAGFVVPEADLVITMANEIGSKVEVVKTKDAEIVAANQATQAANTKVTATELLMANERKDIAGKMLDFCVTTGCMTKSEKETELTGKDFANESQFVALRTKVFALKPKMNMATQLPDGLGHISGDVTAANTKTVARVDAIVEAVNEYQDEQQKKTGKRPDQIAATAYIQKKRPELFTTDENITR